MPYFAVHTPLQAKKDDIAAFKAKVNPAARHQHPVYAALVKSVDESVGRIMAQLDFNTNLEQNDVY